MSEVMPGPEPQPIPPRRVMLALRDADGQVAYPVTIEVSIDGVGAGRITTSRESKSPSVEPLSDFEDLQIRGTFAGETVVVHVTPGSLECQLSFATRMPQDALQTAVQTMPRAEAVCPDGSTGYPCVICVIGERQVRICV